MLEKSIISLTAALVLCACVDDGAPIDDGSSVLRSGTYVHTADPNGDQVLSPGEVTKPEPEFELKPICSQDINLEWTACIVDKSEFGELFISSDANGKQICGDFKTLLECTDYKLSQGPTECVGEKYIYCEVALMPSQEEMYCGWRITELVATNADTGEVLEGFDPEFIEELGFDLFPVPPQ